MTEAVTVSEKKILAEEVSEIMIAEEVLRGEGLPRCIKPLARNAEARARFHSDQREIVRYFAAIVSRVQDTTDLTDLTDPAEDKDSKKDKCIRQHAQSAGNLVKFHSDQWEANRYTAATVSKAATAEVVEVVAETGVVDKWKASSLR